MLSDMATDISTNRRAIELYFYHLLANKNIEKMTDTFETMILHKNNFLPDGYFNNVAQSGD